LLDLLPFEIIAHPFQALLQLFVQVQCQKAAKYITVLNLDHLSLFGPVQNYRR
jgi:hypothetical protein